jgi:hypothetical protein
VTPALEQAVSGSTRAVAAARALYREGLLSESHDYLARALERLVEAWRPEPEPTDDAPAPTDTAPADPEEQALRAIEAAGYPKMPRLRQAFAAVRKGHENPVGSLSSVEWIWAELSRLARFSRRHLRKPTEQKRARIRTLVLAGSALVLLLVVVAVLWARPRVDASGTFSPEHPSYHAFDGVDSSEWLLPETSPGWLDLKFRSPRDVRTVRLVNAHNRYYMDRAAERVRVTAFAGGKALGSAEGRFKGIVEKRSTLDLAIQASGVTRLRVEVLSWHKRGGGLAEIELR